MIYITGDTHGRFGRVADLCKIEGTTKEDILIILGDAGINYHCNKQDWITKQFLSDLPITLFCIKGNHENYAENLSSYKITDFYGGKVFTEEKYPNLIFAKDGEIYNLNGKKTIVIGGAYSIDKYIRLQFGYKWFENEQPSEETKRFVEQQLAKEDWKVDIVLSHTCPLYYEPTEWFLNFVDQRTVDKSTEEWLDDIRKYLKFEKWYCGHFHGEKKKDEIEFLYESIKKF